MIRGFIFLVFTSLVTANAFAQADPNKVLRYAFEIAENTLDPQKAHDVYSIIIFSNIFEAPLEYDYLARPLKLVPKTLTAMPTISKDGLTYTMHVKPGIYFADDPAFKGKKRELVAEDFVYAMKRILDPRLASPHLGEPEGNVAGVDAALIKARKENKFDYDAPLEGIRSLDRYTWQIKLTHPLGVFIYDFADAAITGAVAREVVEFYGDDVGAHPVGTGPYMMSEWKRTARMVLVANPNYREEYFDGHPNADDAEGQAILARLKGKKLPLTGKITVDVIEETQPRLLAFLNDEHDLIWRLPEEFANKVIPNNKLTADLSRRGIHMLQTPLLDLVYAYFNMNDPTVGGYTPEKVALRRAISLAYRTHDEINIIRKKQAIPAQTPYPPGVAGYDPKFKTSMGEYSLPKANALLDMYGYKIGADGYRTMPDGQPLVLIHNTQPTDRDKQFDDLWKRSMDDIKVHIEIRKGKWPDQYKASLAGKLMMWQLGGSSSAPDAEGAMAELYGPNGEKGTNQARFSLPAYDRMYEKAREMQDSPERTKLFQEMTKLVVAYAPWKVNTHRINTDLWQPWVLNFRRPLVQTQPWWKFIDIDLKREQDAKNQ